MFFVIIWYQQNLQAQSAQLEVVLGDPLPPPYPFSLPFPPLCPSCSPPQSPLLPHLWSQPFPHSLHQRHPCRLAGECWATLPLTRMGGPSPLCLHSKSKSSSNFAREPSRDVVSGKSALPLAALDQSHLLRRPLDRFPSTWTSRANHFFQGLECVLKLVILKMNIKCPKL